MNVLDRLSDLNPVPPELRPTLEEELRRAGLPDRIASVPPREPARSRRRLAVGLAAAAVAAALLLVVAPALGIRFPSVNFFGGEKAPAHVERDFAGLSEGAPPGMDPGAIASEAREVETVRLSDGPHTLWVAPTKFGGFCTHWSELFGGCDRLGTVPLSVTRVMAGSNVPPSTGTTRITAIVGGHADADYVDRVEIRFADGDTVEPKIVWVSKPIDAGFFLYEVPAEHQRPGHEVATVVALDSAGERVSEDLTERPDLGVPPRDALTSEQEPIAALETAHGKATILSAPTRYEGRCVWLEFEGWNVGFQPCKPKGYPPDPFGLRLVPTHDDVLLVGSRASEFASVELRFADGKTAQVPLGERFFLYELPDEHLVAGHEATEILGKDADGKTLVSLPVAQVAGGPHGRCLSPLPLPADFDLASCYSKT